MAEEAGTATFRMTFKIKVVLLMVIKNPTAFFRNKWVLASVSLPNINTAVIFLVASVER